MPLSICVFQSEIFSEVFMKSWKTFTYAKSSKTISTHTFISLSFWKYRSRKTFPLNYLWSLLYFVQYLTIYIIFFFWLFVANIFYFGDKNSYFLFPALCFWIISLKQCSFSSLLQLFLDSVFAGCVRFWTQFLATSGFKTF